MNTKPNDSWSDPDDVPEWTAEDFNDPVGVWAIGDKVVTRAEAQTAMRRRGAQKAPTKSLLSLRLDADVLARWKASGPGWQTRMGEVLARAL